MDHTKLKLLKIHQSFVISYFIWLLLKGVNNDQSSCSIKSSIIIQYNGMSYCKYMLKFRKVEYNFIV